MKQLILTCVPSFYKNLAFRKLAKINDIIVFYTHRSEIKRDKDFFKYPLDSDNILKNTGALKNLINLYKLSRQSDFVVVGGWDDLYFWYMRLITPRRKLKLIVESSIYEFKPSLFSNLLKQYFLNGVNKCIVSGEPHVRLVTALGFEGYIKRSLGVGILDFCYPPLMKALPLRVARFLYIGRVSEDKGADLLLKYFANNPELHLNIVGSIEDDKYKNAITQLRNVTYHGYKARHELTEIFYGNDVFLLASRTEPWGLVVEEALYHGLPVVVSDRVGCGEDYVVNVGTGIVFRTDDLEDFSAKMLEIINPNHYYQYCKNISAIDFFKAQKHYIESYIC